MPFLRRFHTAVASCMLLVIVTGWLVVPFCTWVPKLAGCEHVVRLELEGGDLHFAIRHADGTRDHRYHGPDCPQHQAPFDNATDHPKHGVHMPHFERSDTVAVMLPAPAICLSLLPLAIEETLCPDRSGLSDTVAAPDYYPPTELHKTVVLLI